MRPWHVCSERSIVFEIVVGMRSERCFLAGTNERPEMTKPAAMQRVKKARPGGFEPPTYGLEVRRNPTPPDATLRINLEKQGFAKSTSGRYSQSGASVVGMMGGRESKNFRKTVTILLTYYISMVGWNIEVR